MLALRRTTKTFIAFAATVGVGFPAAVGQVTGPGATHTIHVEHFGVGTTVPLMILLHGVNGPSSFYREQAGFFARHGYRVLLPHYLEAGRGLVGTDTNYEAWTTVVRKIIDEVREGSSSPIVVVGYSLGASVALGLGSQDGRLAAIAEFYGSLPDKYFRDLRAMPPLLILHGDQDTNISVNNALQLTQLCSQAELKCDVHIYSKEGHGFTSEALRDADQRTLKFFSQVLDMQTKR